MPDPHIPHPTDCACPRCAPDLVPGDEALFRVLVLGRLGDAALRCLDAQSARPDVGRDRAAGPGPGGRRRGPAVRGRDFVVERRHPRRQGRLAGPAGSGAEPEPSADRVPKAPSRSPASQTPRQGDVQTDRRRGRSISP